jgi:quercetin dioxygenase-like cupin family protein
MKTTLLVLLAGFGVMAVLAAEKSTEKSSSMKEKHVLLNMADVQWTEAPPSLPPGAQFAVLQGNPAKVGVYTVRLKVPSGYKIPPHTHPTTENVSVISGTMSFGMGGTFDDSKGTQITAGGFASMPAHMQHYAWSTGDTVLQVHGQGPFRIDYVNPTDDPRNAKK